MKGVVIMMGARHCKEVSLRVLNDIGIMAQLTKIVAQKGVNIRAAAAWVEDDRTGVIRLVTDDNLRAVDALREHSYSPEEVTSIEVECTHSPGMLSSVCERIGQGGINIKYLYASAHVSDEAALIILSTDDNDRALVLLNEGSGLRFRFGVAPKGPAGDPGRLLLYPRAEPFL